MEAARDALDGAVAALFTSLQALTDGATHAGDNCACGCPLDVPDAWRTLRDFPVLARWIVSKWRLHVEISAPIAQKKTRRAGASTSTRVMELRVSSMSSLCMRLYQCGVLASDTADDTEVVAALLDVTATDVFPRVLQHRSLSLKVRVRLMQYALAACDSGVRVWIEDVCVALQQELRDKSAQTVIASSTRKSKKRSRESIGEGDAKVISSTLCERCVTSGSTDRGRRGRRQGLVDVLTRWTERHQPDGSLADAVSGLRVMLNAPDVVRMLEPPSTRQQGRAQAGRGAAGSSTVRVARSLCDKIVESVSRDSPDGSAAMWRLVWRRESAKVGVQAKLWMEEVVVVCATADQFTRPVAPSQVVTSEQATVSIGFQVVMKVMQETPHQGVSSIQILQAIRGALYRPVLSPNALPLSKTIRSALINYVTRLFLRPVEYSGQPATVDCSKSSGHQSRIKQDPQQPLRTSATISDLLECLSALHEVVRRENSTGQGSVLPIDRRVLFEMWHGAILHLSCQPSSAFSPPWSMFLAAVSQCCEELKTSLPPFVSDFEVFVSSVVTSIIMSNGTRLCSPGSSTAIEIPAHESNRSAIDAMLSLITSSARSSVVVEVLFRVIVAATRSEQINGRIALFRDGGGVRQLLFPSLAVFITAAGPEVIDSRFSSAIIEIYDRIKQRSLGYGHVRALLHLLCAWDSYCERISTSLYQEESSTSQQGLRTALHLQIWEDVVRLYATDTLNHLHQETHTFLSFIMQLLRSVDSARCPAELEGSLFSVLSAISITLQQSRHEDTTSTTVTHSDDTIDQVLSVFARCTSVHRCKSLLNALVKDGKLEDLALSLRRWLGVLAVSPQSLPKESRTELVVLANRLVYHCGANAYVKTIQVLLAPVDPVLISALHAYSTPPTTASSLASATPSISIVRVSLITRSYLETTCVPDLLALTTALADSLLNASTQLARDGLLKLMQGFEKCLITEIIVEKLHDAMLLVGDPARNRIIDNALAILSASESLQKLALSGALFSKELVSLRTTERWLPVFLIASLSSDSAASSTALGQAEAILDCIAHVIEYEERNEGVSMNDTKSGQQSAFSHAYALVALLSTVEAALLKADSVTPIVRGIQDIHAQLRDKLHVASEESGPGDSDYLLCTVYKHSGSQGLGDKKLSSACCYTSGRVRIYNTSATGVPMSGGPWQRTVTVPQETIPESMAGVRFFVPFRSWLRSTFWMPHHQNRLSENVFVDMVLQCYLPVEFHGDHCALTAAWIDAWIEQSLSRTRCIDLSPLLRKVLLQLLSCGSPWPRLVQCAQILLLDQAQAQASIPHDSVMMHIVDSLDLTTLCVMRPSSYDASRTMASDITSLLQQASAKLKKKGATQLSESLRLVTPLFEVLVRVCFDVSSSTPVKDQNLVGDIEATLLPVQAALSELLGSSQDLTDVEWCHAYWLSLVARWKRVYSHLNRSSASRLANALIPPTKFQEG